MKMKTKNRSDRYYINRLTHKHRHKYTKYKKCISMMMLICIDNVKPKQYLKLSS